MCAPVCMLDGAKRLHLLLLCLGWLGPEPPVHPGSSFPPREAPEAPELPLLPWQLQPEVGLGLVWAPSVGGGETAWFPESERLFQSPLCLTCSTAKGPALPMSAQRDHGDTHVGRALCRVDPTISPLPCAPGLEAREGPTNPRPQGGEAHPPPPRTGLACCNRHVPRTQRSSLLGVPGWACAGSAPSPGAPQVPPGCWWEEPELRTLPPIAGRTNDSAEDGDSVESPQEAHAVTQCMSQASRPGSVRALRPCALWKLGVWGPWVLDAGTSRTGLGARQAGALLPQVPTTGWPTSPWPTFPKAQGPRTRLPRGVSPADDAPPWPTILNGTKAQPVAQSWLHQSKLSAATLLWGGAGGHGGHSQAFPGPPHAGLCAHGHNTVSTPHRSPGLLFLGRRCPIWG